jgi:dienelactone hydrolase
VTAAVAAVAAAGLAALAVRSDGGGAQPDVAASSRVVAPTPSVPAVTPTSTAPPSTTAPLPVDRTYAVTTAERTFVDSSRPTAANGSFGGAPERTLVTSFWMPTDPGSYPLVVFAHGYAVTPDVYASMLERWAAAGYVVAAPTYPILSGVPGGAAHTDYPDQTFLDTSFVITSILGLGKDDAVGARVDPERIAAAGHSDGEVVAFGLGFLQCCRDPRVDAVVAMAGDLANAEYGPHERDSGIPILHVMETGDEYDPYGPSIAWDRANLTAPRWMLTLDGASHVPPYRVAGDPHFELLARVVVDFLDGTLKGHPERLDRIAADVDASGGLASLER